MLNMSKLVVSVLADVKGRHALASEVLFFVLASFLNL